VTDFPWGDTITVYREVEDQHGDYVRADERVIVGVAVAPRVSTEPGQDRRTAIVTTGLTLYLPPDAEPITARHTVVLDDGTAWRVQGRPGRWHNPLTDWFPGTQVEIDRVEG
jgi:hypothetical protein